MVMKRRGRLAALSALYSARVLPRSTGPLRPDMTTPCWEWPGLKDREGYGLIPWQSSSGGRTNIKAHRVSWEIHNGTIPPGMDVLHKCDNPPCSRPDHLFLGTLQDNKADEVKKGRQSRGIKHPHARLTEDMVREIRRRHNEDHESGMQISRDPSIGVSYVTVYRILKGEDWAHVT